MTAQRIRSGSDASGIPVPLSKVLPQRLAESVHQIRFIANRASNTKDLAFADSAEHPDTLYQLYPDVQLISKDGKIYYLPMDKAE